MKDENRILKAKISGFPPAEMNMKMAKEFDREELSKIVDFVNSKVE